MNNFAIYNIETGIISKIMTGKTENLLINVQEGEGFYLNCPDDATHIINNEPVTIIPEVAPPTLAEVKTAKCIEIRASAARAMESLAAPYLPQERESWDTQFKEATEWLADSSAPVTMIAAMAGNRGITVADLVGKIMENANLYRDAIGVMLGKQQRLLDEVNSAASVEAVNAIVWQ